MAVGVGKKACPRVLDATAGLGRDSFVLADLGCQVLMCEREPLIAALLRSGLDRARSSGDPWLQAVVARMDLHEGDALDIASRSINPTGKDPEKMEADPETYKITDGKLYMFYNAFGINTKKRWTKKEPTMKLSCYT